MKHEGRSAGAIPFANSATPFIATRCAGATHAPLVVTPTI